MPDSRLALGSTLYFDDRDWTVVGRFRAPNTVMDAEIWLPVTDLQIATNRETTLSCVIVTLDTASFVDVDVFAKTRLDLEITAIPEQEYYASIAAFYAPDPRHGPRHGRGSSRRAASSAGSTRCTPRSPPASARSARSSPSASPARPSS